MVAVGEPVTLLKSGAGVVRGVKRRGRLLLGAGLDGDTDYRKKTKYESLASCR